jgi:hypothetical protein
MKDVSPSLCSARAALASGFQHKSSIAHYSLLIDKSRRFVALAQWHIPRTASRHGGILFVTV